jgi:ribosomal protein S18 acetylase RimI-like enzyme
MADFVTKPLDPATWPAFADLVERNNGVWGGCWCMGFHPEGVGKDTTAELNRDRKFGRVQAGTTHNALVFDGDVCVGWCLFGSAAELTRIKLRRAYESEPLDAPDWRITCFFVDKACRHQGVAAAALTAALDQIAALGGGRVESFPEDTTDRKVSGSFLHNANLALFERNGFERVRKLGKDRWLVARTVAPTRAKRT